MFSVTVRDLMIYEGETAYYIVYLPENEEVCMGDGVDWYFDEHAWAYPAGSDELHAAITDDLMTNYDEFMEAYFG